MRGLAAHSDELVTTGNMVLTVHGLANGCATRLDTGRKRSFGLR
jgi:hypothetical protein